MKDELSLKCPPVPSFRKRTKPLPLRLRISYPLRGLLVKIIDSGLLGLKKLETHVVICGFPRSGTTLLQLMISASSANARTANIERGALKAAKYRLRNHKVMITKSPFDIYHIDEIRSFYKPKGAKAIFFVVLRDPRDVMTSIHSSIPDEYYVSPELWKTLFDHFNYVKQFNDVHIIQYETLINNPEQIQNRLIEAGGWEINRNFDEYLDAVPEKFEKKALNGLRPLDRKRINRWREEQHTKRIAYLLQKLPDLPEYLVKLGYEKDHEWTKKYIDQHDGLEVLSPL